MTTSRRLAGTYGRACLHQHPSPRRGRLWLGATTAQRWGGRLMVSGPRRRTLDPRHVRSRSGSGPARHRAPAHFVEAQAEQGLWQELRDHDASLNWALNEAL
jgi:hypothetical protein